MRVTCWPASVQVRCGAGRPVGPLQLATINSSAGVSVPLTIEMNGFPLGISGYTPTQIMKHLIILVRTIERTEKEMFQQKKAEVMQMEMLEMELIKKLQNTQAI